ncbi:proline--tRNA ligase [Halarcobacter anaerophilus]|uniref:Proline--tRNA ligase n=1 Tax=Halarcobacter anaerophilus TaxID=877500 RepID=A0A4Q0Y1B9_9BACT|nr:proline--tRNA ligase [Halarcobacter anaerophilus]QDF28063.1 prolyl-tRNA synthetase [Halarcobacter anaerophilus]RXJ62409.1 proline--tRNA ligase [Halarcobacter anaerophilus]
MKFSQMFIPTTKETPNDATLPSHQFLVRAGFILQTGAGIYDYMPLGKIVLDKIRAVVKEEMDKSGANEVQFGFVTPLSFWEESGRATAMGPELLKFKDRKGMGFVLSPTNEEAVVNMIKNRITSYKDLPINLYQIYTKFRDEARPRFGLMRGREFLMKDSYSFHATKEDLVREFHVMEETYKNVYTRLGLDFRVVSADSGAIGGSGSKEFMVLANSGEDTLVICPNCEYGANIEAATRKPVKKEPLETKELQKIETPNCKTIAEVSEFLKADPFYSMKAVMKKAVYEELSEVVLFFVRGTDELEETKACNAAGALELEDASEEEVRAANLVPGYCGIINLPENIKVFVDEELKEENNLVCGANEENFHYAGVDLTSMQNLNFADLVAVQEGDICSCCGGKLEYKKGIEAGHIFQLGTKYSEAMDAKFLDSNGKSQPFEMGCYGIGVSRLVAAVIEQNHDEKGCIWTKETAPFIVDVIVSNAKKDEELEAGMKIYEALKNAGVDTIIDDRKQQRFGFKMGDFELIGFPYAVVVGKKLKEGSVEVVDRKTLEKVEISIDEVVNYLIEKIK